MNNKKFDPLPLKEALHKFPKDLKDVVILRFFGDYTLPETTTTLHIQWVLLPLVSE